MRYFLLFAGVVLISLSACVTPEVTQKPAGNIDFTRFKTVAYKVHANPDTEYGSDKQYATSTISLLDTLVGKKLAAMGYAVVASETKPDLTLDLSVTAVKEGSGAARFWVGFGAGRAVLLFDAAFTDSKGAPLAGFQGGRSYTGMEFGKAFAGKDDISIMAATRSVDQIEEFMKNGGTFREDKGKP
jgi:hypothetical protein